MTARLFRPFLPFTKHHCIECGKKLHQFEHEYYRYRCEGCEGLLRLRIIAWKNGAPDPELDKLFGGEEGEFKALFEDLED